VDFISSNSVLQDFISFCSVLQDFISSKSIATVGVTLMFGAKVDRSACLAAADPAADDVVTARVDAA